MAGLKAKGGFVGKRDYGSKVRKKSIVGIFITTFVVVVVLFMLGTAIFTGAIGKVNNTDMRAYKGTTMMLGKGGTTPYICYGNNSFVILWFGKDSSGSWMLNATLMDIYGNIEKNLTISTDLALYNSKPSGMGPRIAYDSLDNIFLAIWYSSNKSIDGVFLTPTLNVMGSTFVLNGTVSVDYHAFALTYIGGSKFLVIWNNGKYDNYYRIVQYSNGTPIMGTISRISTDASHSHINDVVAYDPTTGNIMVVWRNSTGTSGDYNITGKIFDHTMGKVVKNDFTIANGFGDGKGYDIPNIAAGDGRFMVIYANRASPYDVYGVIINASNGNVMNRFEIGNSYYGVKYYGMGIAYNGTGGFMISWPGSDKNIMATLYKCNGTKVAEYKLTNSTDSMEAPVVSVGFMPTRASSVVYQFVWYDYTTGELYTTNLSESALVPEFSSLLPVLAVLIVGIVLLRRRR